MTAATKAEAISLQQAAIVLGVSERTIRRWGKSGRLELVRVGPKLLRVPRDVLARMRRQREAVAIVTPAPADCGPMLERDVADLVRLMRDEDIDPRPAFLVTPRHI